MVFVLSENEAGLILNLDLIVVDSRSDHETTLFHKVHILEHRLVFLVLLEKQLCVVSFEDLYKVDVRC